MTVKMTRKTPWFSELFIFRDSTFVAVDLSCPPRVSVQDYCDKQHWEGEGTGKKQKKKSIHRVQRKSVLQLTIGVSCS